MSRKRPVNVALIGQAFMGRAHSNAWTQVNRFFSPPRTAFMHTLVARNEDTLKDFAPRWGWSRWSTDWKEVVRDPEIDLVDIGVPNNMHCRMAVEALRAGKHVACEKPLAHTLTDGRKMVEAALAAKGRTFVWYNYRRCPAVAFAHQLVQRGRIGSIRHVRATYLQDWADESVPLMWRFDKKVAGSGSNGDLNAHIIDMVRFVTGEEIREICGAIFETFIKERTKMTGSAAGGIAAGIKAGTGKGKVTVDDAVLMLARLEGGAVAFFEATRMATGNHNRMGFEINGTKGGLRFNFERMNELEFYDATEDRSVQGWHTINCTHGGSHPYAEAWWPECHVIGYEHTFANQAYDILLALSGRKPTVALPDFDDACKTQRVLEAAAVSARQKRWVKVSEVK